MASIAQQISATRVLTVLDARMNEVYWAAYERAPEGWTCITEPLLSAPESVALPDDRSWTGAGNGLTLLRSEQLSLVERHPETMPDAAAIVALAVPAFARGEGTDAALAAPIYLRDKVAMTTGERRLKARATSQTQSA